jgi:hypothetical protein
VRHTVVFMSLAEIGCSRPAPCTFRAVAMMGVRLFTAALLAFTTGCAFNSGGGAHLAPCTDDASCGPGETCYRDLCVSRECAIAAECGSGREFTCTGGLCHAVTCGEGCGPAFACDSDGSCLAIEPCHGDAECDDGKPCNGQERCEDGSCVAGTTVVCEPPSLCVVALCDDDAPGDHCVTNPAYDGRPCSTDRFCLLDETCFDGVCQGGSPRDCSAQSDGCHEGVCSEAAGTCLKTPHPDGTTCDDHNPCTAGDTCQTSVCAGTPYACAATQCQASSTCDGSGGCVTVNKQDGDPCTGSERCMDYACSGGSCVETAKNCVDAYDCTDDSCDPATGLCVNASNDAHCGGSHCVPECFGTSNGGCGTPPSALALSCTSPFSVRPLDTPPADACTVTLTGGDTTEQTGCIQCLPHRGITEFLFTDFDNGAASSPACDLDGWAFDASSSCAGSWCAPAGFGALAFKADAATCVKPIIARNLTESTTNLSDVNVCFDYASSATADPADYLRFYAGGTGTMLFEDFGGPLPLSQAPKWLRTCVVLPATGGAAVNKELRFEAHSSGNGRVIYLDAIRVFAYDLTTAHWNTIPSSVADFSTCPTIPGWNLSGGICVTGSAKYLEANKSTAATAVLTSNAIDTTAYDGDLILSFALKGTNLDHADSVAVEMSTASSEQFTHTLLAQNGALTAAFTTFRVNLMQVDHGTDPSPKHNPNLKLRFTLASGTNGHKIDLDDVKLEELILSGPSSVVSLSAVTESGSGSYSFTASSSAVEPAQISCSWGPPTAATLDDIASVDFVP